MAQGIRIDPVESAARQARAEAQTSRVLDALPEGWTVYRNLRWPTRDYPHIDHVVLGPAGIFVIDTRDWQGRVAVTRDEVRHDGNARHSEVLGASQAAQALAELVAVVDARHVQPVLCFARDEWLNGRARDVLVCSSVNLDAMILSREPRLRDEQLRAAARHLEAASSRAPAPVPPPVTRRGKRRQVMPRDGLGMEWLLFLLMGLIAMLALVAPRFSG